MAQTRQNLMEDAEPAPIFIGVENKRITDIETTFFDTLIDAFIERETKDTGELRAQLFYETLEAIFQNPSEAPTVSLLAQVVDSQLPKLETTPGRNV